MNNKAIYLLARWLSEQKGGHFEDDQNIEILEELDFIFRVEQPKHSGKMGKRMAYAAVIKRVIELDEIWTRAALYNYIKKSEE